MGSNYNQRAQVARQRALRELARRHDQEFAAEQRKAQGLDEIDPSRFKGDRYERTAG